MLDRVLRGLERRSAPIEAYGIPGGGSGWIGFPLYGGRTDAGRLVSPDTAVELVAVYGAMRLISSAIGSMPLKVYRDADTRIEAVNSRQWRMLHDAPNDEMAADEFWEIVTMNLLGWGNAFILKERDRNGSVINLWPIRSSRVQVGRTTIKDRSVRYFTVTGVDGPVYEVDILHLRGPSFDGQVGMSPIQLARQDIANGLEQDTFRGSFWRNSMFAGGMLTHPNRLSVDAQNRLAQQIAAKAGASRAGELLVLEEGMTLQNLTMPLEDAQFIEQAKLTDLRISQLFGLMPPHMWGQAENSRSMTYQNSEFGGQEFVKYALRGWMVRIERGIGRDPGIFPAPGPTLIPEFDPYALLRADMQTLWNTYAVGVANGWIDPQWVQEKEHIQIDRIIVPPTLQAAQQQADQEGEAEPGDSPAEEQSGRSEQRAQVIYVEAAQPVQAPLFDADTFRDLAGAIRESRAQFTIEAPNVTVEPPTVENHVHVPEQRAADIPAPVIENHVHVPEQPAPTVRNTVNVPQQPPAEVTVTVEERPISAQVDFTRGPNGQLKSAQISED